VPITVLGAKLLIAEYKFFFKKNRFIDKNLRMAKIFLLFILVILFQINFSGNQLENSINLLKIQ